MFSRIRNLFTRKERVHKRPFVTAVTVSVIFLLISSFLFVSLGLFRMGSDYPKVSVSQNRNGIASSGLGLNLSYIPSTNLVWDASFENNYVEDVFSVAEAEGNSVFLHHSSSKIETILQSYHKSGKLRIMAYDEDGRMNQILDAGVVDYSKNQLGIWKPMESEISRAEEVKKICSNDEYSAAIMANGDMITYIHTSTQFAIESPDENDPFVDSFSFGKRDYAVTRHGRFFSSSGGRLWSELGGNAEPNEDTDIRALTVIGQTVIACGGQGKVLVHEGNRVIEPKTGEESSFSTAVSDGKRALLCAENGTVLTTSNGTVFRALGQDELSCESEDSWILSSFDNGKITLLDAKGQMAIGSFDEEAQKWSFTRYTDSLEKNYSPKQLVCFSNGDVWMLTFGGYIYSYSFVENKWERLNDERNSEISAMGITSDENLLFVRKGTLYTSSLFTKVTIDREIGDALIQNGDVCYLTVAVPSMNQEGMSAWEVFGEDSVVQNAQNAPKTTGERSLHLFSSNPDVEKAHFVSQVISRDEVSPMKDKAFYHVRLWLKQGNLTGGRVMVWLSGLSEPIGSTFTEVSSSWREYSFTFAWPSGYVPSEESQIRLNIGFYGSGELYCDGVRLEREGFSDSEIEPQLVKLLENNQPEYIRLDNLGFGKLGSTIQSNLLLNGNERLNIVGEHGVSGTGVISLESTLRLVKQVNANPWLVIDSAFSKEDSDVLLSYLCGSITEPYGKVRVDNGTAVPWARQFDRILIEVTDSNGLFETDMERGSYVDYVISLIRNSKYYVDIKDKIVLIDGMQYVGGTMNSQADYHASTLHISNDAANKEIQNGDLSSLLDSQYQDYQDAIPRIPASYIQETKGEWVSDLSVSIITRQVYDNEVITVEQPLTAANIARCMLEDLGEHTAFVTVDLPVSRLDGDADEDFFFARDDDRLQNRYTTSANMETAIHTVGVLHSISKGYRVDTNWTVPLSKTNEEGYQVELLSYAFTSNGNTYLIVVNPTPEQQQFLIEADVPVRDIEVFRYSANCKSIGLASTGNILRLNERRYTLQAGQICIAIIPSEEKT